MRVADQAFMASQKGKGKTGTSMASKQKSTNTMQPKKEDKDEKKASKYKMFCKYYEASDHIIKNCQKLLAKEAKKK